MNRPWMPLYIADYRADTAHLSAAEHGAYLLLIMHYWSTGSLPNDDRPLARIACMTVAEWKRTRPVVQAFFHDGWRHKRIDAEMQKTSEVSEAYATRARQAANKRWAKHASSMHQAMHDDCLGMPISQPQSERKKENSIPADAGSPPVVYAFESGVIKLKQKDFDQWKQSFTHLDLAAELVGLAAWAATEKRWFPAVSGALAKKNREAHLRIEQAKNGPEFRWKSGIEGVQ